VTDALRMSTAAASTATAWGIGGRRFEFESVIADALTPGVHVELTSADGRRFLGQVVSTTVLETASGRSLRGSGTLLARFDSGIWQPATSADVISDARAELASSAVVGEWLRGELSDVGRLALGHGLYGDQLAEVDLAARGFNRHSFLCGQSGSGKTYTLGVALEQLLLETELQLLIFDPNSDYVGLTDLGEPVGEADAERLRDLAGRVCVFRAHEGPYRLRVRFGRMPITVRALILALDPLRDADEYDALRQVSDAMGTPEYSLADLRARLRVDGDGAQRALARRIDNLGVLDWTIWAGDDEKPLLDQLPENWRAAVIDLGGLETASERSATAAALLAGVWARRHERTPMLIVIDEAHNVCPQQPTDHHQALAIEHAINIAAEGRKFGLYLLLSTQRPQKLHVNVLSQCENLILMHVNSLADIDYLATSFSQVPRSLIEQAPGFGLGEGLVAGRITPCPVMFRGGQRRSREGGSDVATTWAQRGVSG
jgi:hypothetical protein